MPFLYPNTYRVGVDIGVSHKLRCNEAAQPLSFSALCDSQPLRQRVLLSRPVVRACGTFQPHSLELPGKNWTPQTNAATHNRSE